VARRTSEAGCNPPSWSRSWLPSSIAAASRAAERRRPTQRPRPSEAVIEAWQLWHLTLEQWTDFGERQFQDPNLHP